MEKQITEYAQAFVDGRAATGLDLEFSAFVAATYGSESVYTAAYGGVVEVTARGRDEILATHYGRDMSLGWDGWTWPCRGVFIGEGRSASRPRGS